MPRQSAKARHPVWEKTRRDLDAPCNQSLQHQPSHVFTMPPLPFPLPLRIGTDLCNVSRIRALITKRQHGKAGRPLCSFLSRVLTHPERSYFWERFGNEELVERKVDDVARFLAGRYECPNVVLCHD